MPSSVVATAIAVPEPYATDLRDARYRFGDPAALVTPTHVTLLGPTEVDEATRAAYEQHLERVAAGHEPFDVHLRGTATFRPVSPVVFVALAQGISDCEQLAAAVRAGPVRREHDFPYHPHVTVAQEVDGAALDRAFEELAGYEAGFHVDRFTLYERIGDVWSPHRDYALGDGSALVEENYG
ncbi:MAG TPA: 2'-5' RNA ligase family protein [Streptosporangiales bacterium]